MSDKQNDSAFAEAMMRATLAMLVERNAIRPNDVDIILKAANDRIRHGVDMTIEHRPEDEKMALRGAA